VAAKFLRQGSFDFILIPPSFASQRGKKKSQGNEVIEDRALSEDKRTANAKPNKQSTA